MPLAPLELVETTFYMRHRAQNGVIVRHYHVTAIAGGSVEVEHVAQKIYFDFSAHIAALMHTDATFLGVRAQVVIGERTDQGYNSDPAVTGTAGTDPMPSQICGVLSLRTGLAGRSRRGRLYMPFPSESDNDAQGKPSSGYLDLLHALGNQIKAVVTVTKSVGNTATLAPVIYSRKNGNWAPITGFIKRTEWGTQRRRSQIGRGDLPPLP